MGYSSKIIHPLYPTVNKSKQKKIFSKKSLDKHNFVWYIIKAVRKDGTTEYGLERWLSWSKAHDWKSCNG